MSRIKLLSGILLACGLAGANDVTTGLNRFSASVYEQVAKGGGNVILSPFSISSALSMTMAGARGQTAAEMCKVLGQMRDDPKYHEQYHALIDQILKAANGGGNQLLSANRLWIQQDFNTLAQFRDTLQNVYQAPAAKVDFEHNLESARAAINAWTGEQTKGKIHDLFAPGTLDGRTRLVLSSAVYFYGKWEHAFQRTETRPEPFTLSSGTTEQADFMHQTGRFGYAETPVGQLLEMRYAGTGLALDILLPKKGAPSDTLEAGLDPDRLSAWLGSLGNRSVQVAIPKFRIEYQTSLVPVLQTLGMRSAFSPTADFSGIDDRRDLQISQVVHKAYVDVNEEGTEAAAATGVGVALVAMVRSEVPVFRADRPFAFQIRDTRSGLVLFTGRVTDPKR
jgi:serine protease inhibitor